MKTMTYATAMSIGRCLANVPDSDIRLTTNEKAIKILYKRIAVLRAKLVEKK